MSYADAEAEFERAWADPRYTRAELIPVDVNKVLAERYTTGEPLRLTRAMLWDMEVRKAGSPGAFIPYVVKEGSDSAWAPGRTDGVLGDAFVRQSLQRLWVDPEEYGLVLEEVWLNHEREVVTFLGRAEMADAEGKPLTADPRQPLFHVQHGVDGTDEHALNTWRIVLLTDAPDARFEEPFAALDRDPYLPGFVEHYIRDVLGVRLDRIG
ncbi:hypothetical protein U9R90_04710 [Streptomyces sp. E11-3]|uniref:hypothetical protein n=1 Tax=Streptomyces sp. E11-3 TaxID=3110112 RepID=UPI0039800F77